MMTKKEANFDKRKNPTSFSDKHFALVDMQENVNMTLLILLYFYVTSKYDHTTVTQ